MKSVMISIKPKWCELIASGRKTIEVRKSRPKIEVPFKCYIYCTSVKGLNLQDYVNVHRATNGAVDDWSDKVIGEFTCDETLQFNHDDYNPPDYDISDDDLNRTCLLQEDLYRYASGKTLYGWHISDLVIYDVPRELSDFSSGSSRLTSAKTKDGFPWKWSGMMRPPQSWCYVEEEEK